MELDGGSYLPVDRQGMSTMLELRTYLRGLFSEEVTDQLLETGGSRPCTGRWTAPCMCAPTVAGKKDPHKGGVNAQVKQENETSYAVNVTVDLLDGDRREVTGVECYAFPISGWRTGGSLPSFSWYTE